MTRHHSSIAVLIWTLLVLTNNTTLGQTVRVHNDMDSGVWLWMKSEVNRDWNRWFVRRGQYLDVRLVSPDRFQVVVDDAQGARYSGGLLALRAMIAENPLGVLQIGGIKETKAMQYYAYVPSEGRWRLFQRTTEARVAVTLTVIVNGKQIKSEVVHPDE